MPKKTAEKELETKDVSQEKEEPKTGSEEKAEDKKPEAAEFMSEQGKTPMGDKLEDILLTEEEKKEMKELAEKREKMMRGEKIDEEEEKAEEKKELKSKEGKEEKEPKEEKTEEKEEVKEKEEKKEKEESEEKEEKKEEVDYEKRYKDLQASFTRTRQQLAQLQEELLKKEALKYDLQKRTPKIDVSKFIDKEGNVDLQGYTNAVMENVVKTMEQGINSFYRHMAGEIEQRFGSLPQMIMGVFSQMATVDNRVKELEEKYPILTKNQQFRDRVADRIAQEKSKGSKKTEEEIIEEELKVLAEMAKAQGFQQVEEKEDKTVELKQGQEKELPEIKPEDEIVEGILKAAKPKSPLLS